MKVIHVNFSDKIKNKFFIHVSRRSHTNFKNIRISIDNKLSNNYIKKFCIFYYFFNKSPSYSFEFWDFCTTFSTNNS